MKIFYLKYRWLWMIAAAVCFNACCSVSQFNSVHNAARQYEEKGDFQNALHKYREAKAICANEGNVDEDIRRVNGKLEAHQYYLEGQQATYKRKKKEACSYFLKAYELWPEHPRLATKIKRCRNVRKQAGTIENKKQAVLSTSGPSVTHKVRHGESLSGIITNYYGEYKRLIATIKKYNRIKGDLKTGKKIKLPTLTISGEGVISPKRRPAVVKKRPQKPAPASSGIQKAPKIEPCKTFLDQAYTQFKAGRYHQALENFEAAEACPEGCRECRKYIFYLEGLLLSREGQQSEALDPLEDALEFDPNNRFRPSNPKIQTLKKQIKSEQFKSFQSDLNRALTRYKKARQFEKIRKLFDTGNYLIVFKWIDDSATNGRREKKSLQKIRREAEECVQCHEYELSLKQRLYREAVSHDKSERPLQAFITWDTLHAIDASYKKVDQKRNDARIILKKLLPLM